MVKKTKLKTLLPSLKEKKRYLVFEIKSEKKFDFKDVASAVLGSFKGLVGDMGMAKASVWLLPDKWDKKMQRGIIRLNHKHVNELKAALTLIKEIKGQSVIAQSVSVSGILNKAENYLR
ncbi:hypothetical protein KY330_04960 [Candidatus Woesearchaeota archaeon]|nr:hypothetical protein [Candidatus Woesearchaeota archaeon]